MRLLAFFGCGHEARGQGIMDLMQDVLTHAWMGNHILFCHMTTVRGYSNIGVMGTLGYIYIYIDRKNIYFLLLCVVTTTFDIPPKIT